MRYFENDIFPVALVVSTDAESVDKEYYNAYAGEEEHVVLKPTSQATTMFLSRRAEYRAMAVGILFNKVPTTRIITHESFHAARMMLDVGLHIPLIDDNEEVYAYVAGWIADCVEKYFKELNN